MTQAVVADIQAEVLKQGTPAAQLMDVYVEVLRTPVPPVRRRFTYLSITIVDALGYPANAIFVDGDPMFIDGNTVEL